MTARVRNIDYTMFFDGQKVRMGGISAVSSLPEARGKGRVRAILHGVLSEDRSNGVMFSVLSPFSLHFIGNLAMRWPTKSANIHFLSNVCFLMPKRLFKPACISQAIRWMILMPSTMPPARVITWLWCAQIGNG